LLAACSRPAVEAPPTKGEIWAAIQPPAQLYRIDLAFIYALVAAESAFDPQARNGEAGGLLQLKPAAWGRRIGGSLRTDRVGRLPPQPDRRGRASRSFRRVNHGPARPGA
jgi:hypothetical protein